MVGSGAREHTLVWKLAQSPKVKEIFVAPGNGGTAHIAHNLDISATDIEALVKAARDHRIDLTVVGPEAPLAKGIADQFLVRGMPVFGATRMAAEIETSKAFAKQFMQQHGIPCARSVTFESYEAAHKYVADQKPPIVIKADGLAAGKGVVTARSTSEALDALADFMQKRTLGAAGQKVVVEEFLTGREMSAFGFADAHFITMAACACDYKRAYDGDCGPNTGGMGSYSPPHFLTEALSRRVYETIMKPTSQAMHDDGRPYRGVLYGGLMITNDGPKVLEFNARFGDPETQVILPRLKTDLVDIMLAIVFNRLKDLKIEWTDEACVGVVMASAGYPGSYETGFPITGLNDLDKDIMVFHGGTRPGPDGELITSGGRVLTVAAAGKTIDEAREKVYANLSRIHFQGSQYRKDIALLKAE